MAKIKGKFIMMACSLLELNPAAKREASQTVKRLTGNAWGRLTPEGWYDASVIDAVFQVAEKQYGNLMGPTVIKVMGRRVYTNPLLNCLKYFLTFIIFRI